MSPAHKPAAIFSLDALRRAWRQVRRAGGGPGVDGISIQRFGRQLDRNLAELQSELLSGRYRPRKVQRMLMPKPNGEWRRLAIWTLRDRIAQRAVHDYLEPRMERVFLDCSYGFRPGRTVSDAVNAVNRARDDDRRWVVDADIKDCFGSIPTGRLMRIVRDQVPEPLLRELIERWLKARVFNARRGMPATTGVTQGGVISPTLANLYLHQFDEWMVSRGLRSGRQTCSLVRFADDFVLLCRSKRDATRAMKACARGLGRLELKLHPQKSRIVHFDQGFKFLGHFFLRDEVFNLS